MSKKVWLITGAARGMGVEFVKASGIAGADAVELRPYEPRGS